MTQFQILSKSQHLHLKLKKTHQLKWAMNDNICELFIDELKHCTNFLPIAFIKNNNLENKEEVKFKLIGLCGIVKNKNAFLNESMVWTGNYIPAIYRSYPFKIMIDKDNSEKKILCFDRDNDLFTEEENDNSSTALFDKDGGPSELLKKIIELMLSLENSMIKTNKAIKMITDLNLFEEWKIKVKTGDKEIKTTDGLYQIKKDGIRNLNKEELFQLKESNGLELIYSHFYSQRNISSFSGKNEENFRDLRKEVQVKQEKEKIKEVDNLVKNLLNEV